MTIKYQKEDLLITVPTDLLVNSTIQTCSLEISLFSWHPSGSCLSRGLRCFTTWSAFGRALQGIACRATEAHSSCSVTFPTQAWEKWRANWLLILRPLEICEWVCSNCWAIFKTEPQTQPILNDSWKWINIIVNFFNVCLQQLNKNVSLITIVQPKKI